MRRLKCTTNVQNAIRVTKNFYSFCFLHHSYIWNQCHSCIYSYNFNFYYYSNQICFNHIFLPYVTSAQLYQLLQGIANAVQLSYIIFYQASTSRVTEFKSAKHGEIRQWPHLDLWKLTDCLIRMQRKKAKIKAAGEPSPPQPLTHISYKWDARHALTLMYVLLDPSPFSSNVAHSSIESVVWAVSACFR